MTENNDIYSLENLIEKFSEHAIIAQEYRNAEMKHFQELFPDDPVPEHFKNDFSFPKSLAVICSEILKIRDKK